MSERRERFRRLYDDNHSRVLGYALRRTRVAADADDVVAETFLVAWRRLDEVPDGERARLWLYGTARRVLANQRRGRRRQARVAEKLGAEPRHLPQSPADEPDQDWPRVAAAFARLRDTDREVLLLTGWEGLDPGQIAEVLGCTRATARVRLHRARRRLAAELTAEGLQRNATAGHAPQRRATARPDAEEAL